MNLWSGRAAQAFKALFPEMGIETKHPPGPEAAHYRKTRAVYQAELATEGSKQGRDSGAMVWFTGPLDMEQGVDIFLEGPHGFHSEPTLHQGKGFDQDITAAGQHFIIGEEICPRLFRSFVFFVIGVEHGQEGRGVYKDAHVASAR